MNPNDPIAPPLLAGDILQLLTRHGVDFVVIGGVAGSIQGSAYPTYDLDVAYSRDEANLFRLTAALGEMEVSLRGGPPDLPFQLDAVTLANGANFTFDSKFGRFDILGEIDGIRDYPSLRDAARSEEISGVTVRIASIDHLIAMKRAANRTKDKLMLEEYIVIADEQKRLAREKKERGED